LILRQFERLTNHLNKEKKFDVVLFLRFAQKQHNIN